MRREEQIEKLRDTSQRLRVDIIRMLTEAGSGHPGGSLSAIDIITTLFFAKMRHKPEDPQWTGRDRFVLSKGHGVPALYAVLAEAGYFSKDMLMGLRKLGSPLQGHPSNTFLPGIEASTGSLGQGLSVAQGMAMAQKLDGTGARTYCMIGDGESQEGQIWEAAMSAPKFGLDNLCLFVDYNKGQIDGPVTEIMDLEPLAGKWHAFNWHVLTISGHDHGEILDALADAEETRGRPTVVIAHTVKGKGVSFMEHVIDWHGKAPKAEEASKAISELMAREE